MATSLVTAVPDNRLRVAFLDIGQGDAVLISQGSRQILIDGGPSPSDLSQELGRLMPFWDRELEMVILTHAHDDHLAGLAGLPRRFDIGQAVLPAQVESSPLFDAWMCALAQNGTPVITAQGGYTCRLDDDTILRIIALPEAPDVPEDADSRGTVISLTAGEHSFFFTADISGETERALIRRRLVPDVTVLKVAHHGSATSTMFELLAVAAPEYAVISAGRENRYGHPDEAVLYRLETVTVPGGIYRTDINGTIEFVTDGTRLWISTHLTN